MEIIYDKIRECGGRITAVKKALLECFSEKSCILSLRDISEFLEKKNLKPNRSTLYREINLLRKLNIIEKKEISGKSFYEKKGKHHHHIVCVKCKKIEPVLMDNVLEKIEKEISKERNFIILNHNLEFLGKCKKCN
jgi:Fur family transcriptional regulator, ferric uptake regulator